MSSETVATELRQSFQDKEYAHAYAEDFVNAFVATQLKVLREQRGLTQAQLAELTGMKQSRISALEDINYGAWNLKTLRRLAAAFDVALTVKFESFSTFIEDVSTFSRERLFRQPRMEALTAPQVDERTQTPVGKTIRSELRTAAATHAAVSAHSAAAFWTDQLSVASSSVLDNLSGEEMLISSAMLGSRWTIPDSRISALRGAQ
jgi:transcriptional regulator with XRE-family HTH domain